MNKFIYRLSLFILFFLSSIQLTAHAADEKTLVQPAVASAHPLATQAGLEILERGGNAFDAAVAVTAVLAVVEPYSSGLGGGGFYLLHEAKSDEYVMLDARETAPSKAFAEMYLDDAGEKIPGSSITGALSAAIPGIPAAIDYLAQRYGTLKLPALLASAIHHAQHGFVVDEHYQQMVNFRLEALQQNKAASDIFLQQGDVPDLDYMVIQKDLAVTLQQIADHGASAFYNGGLARKMVADVAANGGIWSIGDLADYKVIPREPLVSDYKGMKLVSASLPSSGGLVLSGILGMLQQLDIEGMDEVQRIHYIVEAMRRAYRDRAEYMGDPDYVDVPVSKLLSDVYLKAQAASIDADRATPSASLGNIAQPAGKGTDTTHFSIVDKTGNKVSATLSINYPFGSCFVARGTGILLNDEMDDFSAKPGVPNAYGLIGSSANAIEPGKRMLSSMTPAIVESDERIAIIGTPGGSRIITMILLGVLDFYADKAAGDIVDAARFHHQYLPDEISYETGVFDSEVFAALEKLGHKTRQLGYDYGNMQLIIVDKRSGQVDAASDYRGIGRAEVLR